MASKRWKPNVEVDQTPVELVPGASAAGKWGAAGHYRSYLRTLQPGMALSFRFPDELALRKGRYSIIKAAVSIYGCGRTASRTIRKDLTFHIWLRETPQKEYMPVASHQQKA